MKKNQKIMALVIYSILMLTPIFLYSSIAAGQDDDIQHDGDYDEPIMVESLYNTEMTWRIVNMSGIFADEDLQPGDLIRYQVTQVNTKDNIYKVKVAKKSWGENDFDDYSDSQDADYYLGKRHWGELAVENFILPAAEYWGSADEVDKQYELTFQTEWYDWKMMNTATINLKMNESNYDIIKYSREEGILLSRTTAVNTHDGETRGYIKVEFVSFSGFLALSPWFYIIVVATIVGLIALVVIIIGLLIQRRKNIYREIEEI